MNYDKTEILDAIGKQLRRVANRPIKKDEIQTIYREFEAVFPRYTYPGSDSECHTPLPAGEGRGEGRPVADKRVHP
jgi:hypothetical protein